MLAGLLLALGLAGGLYWSRSHRDNPQPPAEIGKPAIAPSPAPVQVGTVEAPAQAPNAAPPRTSAANEAPPEATAPLEAVEAMLELNLVVAGASSADSADAVTGSIDELLGGKHAGKDKAALMKSLRSVQAVLKAQATPEQIPKEMILTPEAISALTIEAGWLKEHIVN